MPRFVVLHHVLPPDSARASHWDLMLETGDALRTWALAEVPRDMVEIAADALDDHRLVYLEYQGQVSGGRGEVTRWDEGQFDWLAASDDLVRCEVRGERLHGSFELRCSSNEVDNQRWVFLFRNK